MFLAVSLIMFQTFTSSNLFNVSSSESHNGNLFNGSSSDLIMFQTFTSSNLFNVSSSESHNVSDLYFFQPL